MSSEQHPWQRSPAEVIGYALGLMERRSDLHQRIAFLLLDVGVETLFKVYLHLPEEVTGALTSFTKRRQACEGSFHELVNGVEEAAGPRLEGTNLRHVEYYHNVRNKLYHEGDGVTIHPRTAEDYSSIAVKLLDRLLGVSVDKPDPHVVIGERDIYYPPQYCECCGEELDPPPGELGYMICDSPAHLCDHCGFMMASARIEGALEDYWESHRSDDTPADDVAP